MARLREARGLSQRAIAEAMGFSSHTLVRRLEAGDRAPADADEVLRLAAILGLEGRARDELLMSAGYWPRAFLELGRDDATLRSVAEALVHARADGADDGLRRTLEALSAYAVGRRAGGRPSG